MKYAALLAVALTLSAGIGAASAEEAVAAPARIAVAGGALTEIVFTLGHEERLVGVDTTSSWPEAARALPQFGYLRRLSAEGVLSTQPDLLLASPDAGPPAAIEILGAAGLRIATAPETRNLDDVAEKIRFVGDAIGDPVGGAALAEAYATELARVRDAVARIEDRPRILFILTLSDGAPLVGGAGTGADEVIREAGGVNAAAAIDGYKPMNREAMIAAGPEIILMTDAHSDRLGGMEEVMARPDIAITPAGRAGRGVEMDALLLLGMGPRAPEAVKTLARLIHPPEALSAAGL
ncbi:ABC transporter substrate-binding protein [Pikeienuella piscinae]|uniref:ABC transporter substrate-binding protein n=1 Tax=Pikeienuella piscinae TaxID=2748098 RepID=A0A7L5BTY1_9RHOB|nr:ABC transporter substrate-binding protein [Pikeienuella piscinae]QIE55630.1 ABC transporter substrate-binding protein [Pikeienuella piscinae]